MATTPPELNDILNESHTKAKTKKTSSTNKNKLGEKGKKSGNKLQEVLQKVADPLGDQMTEQVMVLAVNKMVSNLQNGNFGNLETYLGQTFSGLSTTLDAESVRLLEGSDGEDEDEDPLYLPAYSEDSENLSFRHSSEQSSNGKGRSEILSVA